MSYTASDLEEARRNEPVLYHGLSDEEALRLLARLPDVPTEVLASELHARGWHVRLTR